MACRYCIYLFSAGLTVGAAWPVPRSLAYATGAFLILSLVMHTVLLRVTKLWPQHIIYYAEWLGFVVYLGLGPLPQFANLCLVLLVLASHTALWGAKWLPGALVGAGLVIWVAQLTTVPVDFSISQPVRSALNTGVASVSAALLLAVCCITHGRVQLLMRHGLALRRDNVRLLRYLPVSLGQPLGAHRLGVNRPFKERVWLTVCFVDLAGFTQATQTLPVERLGPLLDSFMSNTNDQVVAWGGSVAKFLGDGVLCVFPSSSESDRANAALQALRCMQYLPAVANAPAELGLQPDDECPWQLNIGVASGYCYAGDWGGESRLDHTVIGIPVNLACRLQNAAAEHGGLLMDEKSMHLTRSGAGFIQPVGIVLKGLGAVTAYIANGVDKQLVATTSFAKVPPP